QQLVGFLAGVGLLQLLPLLFADQVLGRLHHIGVRGQRSLVHLVQDLGERFLLLLGVGRRRLQPSKFGKKLVSLFLQKLGLQFAGQHAFGERSVLYAQAGLARVGLQVGERILERHGGRPAPLDTRRDAAQQVLLGLDEFALAVDAILLRLGRVHGFLDGIVGGSRRYALHQVG